MADLKYDSKVRDAYSGYLASGLTLPANTNADGEDGPLKFAKTMQRVRVVLVAKTACALADTKKITMKLQDCATEDGSFQDVPGGSNVYTADGATTWAAGEEIMSIPVPHNEDGGDYMNINLATDDSGATGTVDAFLELLP